MTDRFRDILVGAIAGCAAGLILGIAVGVASCSDEARAEIAVRAVEATRPLLAVRDR